MSLFWQVWREITLDPNNKLRWNTWRTANLVEKREAAIYLPPFLIPNVTPWLGASFIVVEFRATASRPFSFLGPVVPPVGVNFCLAVRWTTGTVPSSYAVHRYKLWQGVGEDLDYPLYGGQPIGPSFALEIWTTQLTVGSVLITEGGSIIITEGGEELGTEITVPTTEASLGSAIQLITSLLYEAEQCCDFTIPTETSALVYCELFSLLDSPIPIVFSLCWPFPITPEPPGVCDIVDEHDNHLVDEAGNHIIWCFTPPPPVTVTHVLTVGATDVVTINVNPVDNNGNGDGIVGFTRVYDEGTPVLLNAPLNAVASIFDRWEQDGFPVSYAQQSGVTLDVDHTMEAFYTAPVISADGSICGTIDGTPGFIPGTTLVEWTLAARILSATIPPVGAGYQYYYWSGTDIQDPISALQFFAPVWPAYDPLIAYINAVLNDPLSPYYDFPAIFPGKTFVRIEKLVWCYEGFPLQGLDITSRPPPDVFDQNIGPLSNFAFGWHLNVVVLVSP